MNDKIPKSRTMARWELIPVSVKLVGELLDVLLDSASREVRRQEGVTFRDALFSVVRCLFLSNRLLRYRRPVEFGDVVVYDANFPPILSPALRKRLSNYLNYLDLQRIPSGIFAMSTTNACPYSCAFCSTNAKTNSPDDLDEELLKKTITQVESLGVPQIILHGGEPFFRYDRFLRLVKHVSPDTCLWMFTTGYGATEERTRELKENGLFGVWVSLDHYEPAVHNRLRGNPEAFDNACRAIENFKRAGVYTCLSLVPPDDLHEPKKFRKFYDFARDLGVAEIRVMERKPSGREACRGVTPHSPVLAKLHKDLYKDRAYRKHPPLCGLSTWLEKDESLGCQCRFEYLFITSKGEVQPCEASEVSFGNITQEDFLTIYERICAAFEHPTTGCIPMVMYPEVREYLKVRDKLSSAESGQLATEIIQAFQSKGKLPWASKYVWPFYRRRLKALRKRQARTAVTGPQSSGVPATTRETG